MHNAEEKSWKQKKDQIKSWNTNLPRKSWIKTNQSEYFESHISSHHHFHVMWGTLFGRFGLLGSLCSNKAAADSRWFQGAGCRLPLTTHPSKPEVRRSKGAFFSSKKLHGIFKMFQVFFSQPKLAKTTSLSSAAVPGVILGRRNHFFFNQQELGEKKSEPTTSSP